jgi:hypothetical protein
MRTATGEQKVRNPKHSRGVMREIPAAMSGGDCTWRWKTADEEHFCSRGIHFYIKLSAVNWRLKCHGQYKDLAMGLEQLKIEISRIALSTDVVELVRMPAQHSAE